MSSFVDMDIVEFTVVLSIVIGIGLILYFILRDPLLMLKSLLRGLKGDDNWKIKIILFPIWGPIWLIDRFFRLNIYISNLEQASTPKEISFNDYDKYIIVDTKDLKFIKDLISSLYKDTVGLDFSLFGVDFGFSEYDSNVLIKINNHIGFATYNTLVHTLDNVSPRNKVHHAKGILLNKMDWNDSYYIYVDTGFDFKLIGKTFKNKKIYVEFLGENTNDEVIYFNSEFGHIPKFRFQDFEKGISQIRFDWVDLSPNTQQKI